LTDFLAANNISAAQIRDSYNQRAQAAEATNTTATPTDIEAAALARTDTTGAEVDTTTTTVTVTSTTTAPSKKRKRGGDDKAAEKKKAAAKKAKKGKKGSDDESDDNYEDAMGLDMYKKAKPLPGQLENCEICAKRFTVTAYSKSGPDGGLVCGPCGKELAKEAVGGEKKPKAAVKGKGRRKVESQRLDGILTSGSKTLQQLCIEKVADFHQDIEEFGDLPDNLLSRLSEIFAKRRVIDPRTMKLFLRPDLETVAIHDAAKLEVEDYKQIFAVVPKVKKLVLRNACQFKDEVMEYMMEKAPLITHFQVYAANLITNSMWEKFFKTHGHKLETLSLEWLDATFDDDIVQIMITHCPNLTRLKLKYCRQITAASLVTLAQLKKLNHLSLQLSATVEVDLLIPLITTLGPKLSTLSLESCTEADDTLLDAIRTTCGKLNKLRLTDIDCVSDAAFVSLFSNGSIIPALSYIDFTKARDIDNNNPDGPADNPMGLCSEGFKAMMAHSGLKLRELHIPSCRHISQAAFIDVFSPNKPAPVVEEAAPEDDDDEEMADTTTAPTLAAIALPDHYPNLETLNLSFCSTVEASTIRAIFKTCTSLQKLIAFGCFKILEHVTVPKGKLLVGVPNAQDAIEQVGDDGFGGAFGAGVGWGLDGMGDVGGLLGKGVVEEVGA